MVNVSIFIAGCLFYVLLIIWKLKDVKIENTDTRQCLMSNVKYRWFGLVGLFDTRLGGYLSPLYSDKFIDCCIGTVLQSLYLREENIWPKDGSGRFLGENNDTQNPFHSDFDPIYGLYIYKIHWLSVEI